MKKLKDQSIQTKLLIYFFILIFIPFTSFNIIQFMMNTNGITETLIQNTQHMLFQVDSNISSSIDELIKTARVIENYDATIAFFSNGNNEDIETSSREFLSNIKNQYPEISGILLLKSDDTYISNEMYKTSKDPLVSEKWYKEAVKTQEPLIISRPVARNLSTHNQYASDEILSIVMPVSGGVIVIDYFLSNIEELINNTIVGLEGFTYIVDESGDVMFTPVNDITYRIDSKKLLDNSENTLAIDIKGKAYQVIKQASNINQWTIIGVFPIDELYSHVNRFKAFQFMIILLTVVLTFVFTMVIDKSITSPIKRLQQLMKKTETGDLTVTYELDRHDEVGQLGMSFNQMIDKLNSLLLLIEKEQKEKLEAELKVLQAQIKPHFLYNTLDTIRWMAIEHKAYDIETVVQALTNLFRIGLNKGQDIITLEDELEHINSYLQIQKFRYEDELMYEVTNDYKDLKVLKLILQPLVENSIYHGIKEKDETGKISIYTTVDQDDLLIMVSDDGPGLTQKKLDLINQALKDNKKLDFGYGIFNINSRLKLTFGDKYGLSMALNKPGVTVTIRHPIIKGARHETTNS